MAKLLRPSPMLESFVRNVQEDFPSDERTKIDKYAEAPSCQIALPSQCNDQGRNEANRLSHRVLSL